MVNDLKKKELQDKSKKVEKSEEVTEVICQFANQPLYKINIINVINKHPKIKNASLSWIFWKNYFKLIKEILEENAGEFK